MTAVYRRCLRQRGLYLIAIVAVFLLAITMSHIPTKLTSFQTLTKLYLNNITWNVDKPAVDTFRGLIPQVNTNTELVTHVRFLKVHKAGSTTIQNMLFRFALRHNLDVLIPRDSNYMFPATPFSPTPKSDHFDIFACHTVYSKDFFDKILPSDSVNIGIVREPAARIISAAYYYRDVFQTPYLKTIPSVNFIHNLVERPDLYDVGVFSHTKNSMGYDFGFRAHVKSTDTEEIASYLHVLDEEFELVMIVERLEESLVLLRRQLRWSLQDIVYMRTNTHTHAADTLQSGHIDRLRQTSFLDYALYDFFSKRFDERLKVAGPGFSSEVDNLKVVLEKVKVFCDGKTANVLEVKETIWSAPFNVTSVECDLMTKDELTFISELRQRQSNRVAGVRR